MSFPDLSLQTRVALLQRADVGLDAVQHAGGGGGAALGCGEDRRGIGGGEGVDFRVEILGIEEETRERGGQVEGGCVIWGGGGMEEAVGVGDRGEGGGEEERIVDVG